MIVGLLAFLGFGCEKAPLTMDGISIKEIPSDIPAFKREYTAKIDARCSIKISLRSWWHGDRMKSGELNQPDGKWLLFDPDAVADKIIDPILVPLVQAKVDAILAMDKAYMDSEPSEFTDETGVRWQRMK